jgi:molecular chaperone HtpG
VESDADKAEKYAKLFYYQGLMMAGLPIEDPVAYSDLVCEFMR